MSVCRARSLEEAGGLAPPGAWDVVAFRAEALAPLSPAESLVALREIAPEATFLPVTQHPDPREALFYLKHGAFEYLEEPLSPEDFLRALGEAVENRETFREILELNQTLETQKQELLREKRDLERKNRELEAVARLARVLASTLDAEEVLDQLTRCIHDTLGFERIVVGLVDPAGELEEAKAALGAGREGLEDSFLGTRWSLDDADRHPWIRTVFREGRPLRVDDPSTHPETRATPLAQVHCNPFVKLPMVAQGRIVGTITVESHEPGRPVGDEDVGILEVFADTAAIAVENARLYHTMRELSLRDELTGLYNRRHLFRQLEAECDHARRHDMPLALLMIDIDYFKQLNDGNDHLTGDAALRKLASILLGNTRGIDTVARYGGEEFAVVLPRTSRENSPVVGEKLRRLVEETPFAGEEVVPSGTLTVSVGAASLPTDDSSPQSLIERADRALYRAKAQGRNRVCVWHEEGGSETG